MPEKRKTLRKKMVLPVRFSGAKDSLLAHTLDITPTGARIGAIRERLKPGTIVDLQRGQKKAKFRIVWVRQVAPNEMQAGVEAMESQANFWGLSLSDEDPDSSESLQTFLNVLSDSSNAQLNQRSVLPSRGKSGGQAL
jgi:hypothetical protein